MESEDMADKRERSKTLADSLPSAVKAGNMEMMTTLLNHGAVIPSSLLLRGADLAAAPFPDKVPPSQCAAIVSIE
jgi:hypothetical protein